MEDQVVYTTTGFGAIILYAAIASFVLMVVGFITGLNGITAGGMALLGSLLVVSTVVSDRNT